ncbi:sn-glycerol-3-phosphate ABC transporter ATP-binding protein UgpC [Burkholderiaceae bacterium DAT-1]|nr:sn-glycerol-3-phosphate ABC transporter ATP-binding protein UgpC [Burkholderiaceae bacterium DAT-1]
MATIRLSGVSKTFDQHTVVHGLDLDIREGEFIVLLGPSGCAKSTTLRMLAGLESISTGELLMDDVRVNDLSPKERGVAMVFQNYALYPHMTVRDNIGFSLKMSGVAKAQIRTSVDEVARVLELDQLLDRYPAALSGGQRQRVAIGRAMVRKPKVFLFDEPLSNLDAKLRHTMRTEIRELHQRVKATMVYVTHDQVEAMTLADRIVIMNKGRIEQVGTPEEIYRHPRNRFVATFIGAPTMNVLPFSILAGTRFGQSLLAGYRTIPADAGIGIRPNHLHQCDAAEANLQATVTLSEYLGNERIVHAHIADHLMVIQVPEHVHVQTGQVLHLRADAALCHVFDAQSGERIACAAATSPLDQHVIA